MSKLKHPTAYHLSQVQPLTVGTNLSPIEYYGSSSYLDILQLDSIEDTQSMIDTQTMMDTQPMMDPLGMPMNSTFHIMDTAGRDIDRLPDMSGSFSTCSPGSCTSFMNHCHPSLMQTHRSYSASAPININTRFIETMSHHYPYNMDPIMQSSFGPDHSEKKRRRKELHNQVEKRRRENINNQIQTLCTMLPDNMVDEITKNNTNGNHNNKPNKGAILRQAVGLIKQLEREKLEHHHRVAELEQILSNLLL
ncbi:hypothetical protein BDB01DRAFT_799987 [Pilobolus umbonatus]|nr:hypothetical protein BDB01DRAFT_799987 [Pilobolus umbonatus]